MTRHLGLFVFLSVVILGCSPATTPGGTAIARSGPDTQRVATKARPIPKADFTLSPEDFAQQLKADEAGTTAKYRGKVIEVTGYLDRYINASLDKVQLCIRVPDRFLYIFCNMPDPDPWDVAAPGQTVTVRGTFPDKFILPTLTDCVIVKASGECRSRLTATELARRCDADPEAVQAEFEYGGLVVSGVVEEAEKKGLYWWVTFRTGTTYRVVVEMSWPVSDEERIRAGNRIRVVGIFSKVDTKTGEVRFSSGILATTD